MKTTPKKKTGLRRGEAVTTITRKVSRDAPEKVFERRIKVDNLPEHPARVRVEGGFTKNMGDFNSCRISVMVEVPCHPDDRSIKANYKRASDLVEECLDEEYNKVIGDDDE